MKLLLSTVYSNVSRSLILLGVLAMLLIGTADQAQAQTNAVDPQDDVQFWNEVQVIVPVQEKIDLVMIGVLRLGRNLSHFVDERAGAGVAFKAHKYLTITPTYLYVAQQPSGTRKNFEHRLILNATAHFALGKFVFTDRNLIERRLRHSLNNTTIYRNRLQIDHPVNLGKIEMRVFVADEVFYFGPQRAWSRNRISAGIIKKFSNQMTGEFFYLRQNDGRARPGDVHAFGTLLRFFL